MMLEQDWTPTVFVVEDDDTIRMGLVHGLEAADYKVRSFEHGETALAAIIEAAPDLLVLDVMLPGIDGLEVLKRVKARSPDLPIILLTAKTAEQDRVAGLDLGADDYVTKPFSLKELVARVRARLRAMTQVKAPDTFAFGDCEVDLRRRILTTRGEEARLTTHEAGVLAYLIAYQGKDVTREELLEKVWGYAPTMQTRTVDNQILKLRKKVEPVPADPRHILTVHGVGYRFEP
jgi:two-component system, OmpR family, alkaline phosphatase synthesis response regulator PhoP